MALTEIEYALLGVLQAKGPIVGTAQVGYALWPDRRMQPQGAALAAGKVIRGLRDRLLVTSHSHGPAGVQSRYEITGRGRAEWAAVTEQNAAQKNLLN